MITAGPGMESYWERIGILVRPWRSIREIRMCFPTRTSSPEPSITWWYLEAEAVLLDEEDNLAF